MSTDCVLIKGAGDLASGVAYVFKKEGYRVLMTEIERPTCVRRTVSFAEAVYEGKICVQGIWGRLAKDMDEITTIMDGGDIAVLVDPRCEVIGTLRPFIYIDATMAKRNLGTKIDDAKIVIALGPGFEAGKDAHAVIETQRGPNLGEPIFSGMAAPNTGIPGNVLGYTIERVLRAPVDGIFDAKLKIGDLVERGETVAVVNGSPVQAAITGVVRGLLRNGLGVYKGMKVGDIHPAKDREVCFTITDKAMAIGYGALKAVRALQEKNQLCR
ncbi:selenium-dependent molybdenum cofactor biosynthesis protein YqeB [Desulfallas sp. Bu1-1]|uniref:selenium-dependent molybdenum cofactor biosynthesis protein YqeB n=1 Tax=Desulfallas sp. Bu1-1 TaxID=2787620 RepID=UPI001FAC4444|nr:selenium-dependent molybdenum cofactor biosynthesis protein YqeB [Desulfallas sp. Bu1-1]